MQNPITEDEEQEVLAVLRTSGDASDYIRIKSLVSFGFPQVRVLFVQMFGRRTIAQVLREVDETRVFVEKNAILSTDQKSEIVKSISQAELIAWNALLEANLPEIGPWVVSQDALPTGYDEQLEPYYFFPTVKLTAIHSETSEVREAIIEGKGLNDSQTCRNAWMQAFKDLGIWDLVYKGPAGRSLVSSRRPQGWPIFTQNIIPRLYECLYECYAKPGHFSEQRDTLAPGNILFSKELTLRMLDILRSEYPEEFATTTVAQLNAVVQRYLAAKSKITKSSRTA
jgi:hypothetical protein